MVLGIKLEFGGSLGVLVLGALMMAGAAYLDGFYYEYGRFSVLFNIGMVVMLVGGIITSITTSTWKKYMDKKIQLMPYD